MLLTSREAALVKTVDRLLVTLDQLAPNRSPGDVLEEVALSLIAEFCAEHPEHPVTLSIIDRLQSLGLADECS